MTGVREETVVEKEILLFGGLLLDHYFPLIGGRSGDRMDMLLGRRALSADVPPIWQ